MHDKIESVVKSPYFVPAAIGVTSFVGGLGVGFFLGIRKAQEVLQDFEEVHTAPEHLDFDFEMNEEVIEEVVEIIEETPQTKVIVDVEDAVELGIVKVDSLADLRPSMVDDEAEESEEDDEDVPEIIVQTEPNIEWDWEEEVESRTETEPYILHRDEFYEDEKNYSQLSLTYFAGDDVLVDQDNQPIGMYSNVTGPITFGHGSGQENVVYIRNDDRRCEYEITRVPESFAIEVLGMHAEDVARTKDLRHGKDLRFRMD